MSNKSVRYQFGSFPFIAAILLLFGLICLNVILHAQFSPKVELEKTPIPPEQNDPWTSPPTTLSPAVVSGISQLFSDGMADPRGCEYREIQIQISPKYKENVHGWVLPGTGKQRYGIGWNGVVYPLASVGASVDLQKEFSVSPPGSFRGNGNGWPMSDRMSLLTVTELPIKTAMLLRLGQVDLAEKVWNAGYLGADQAKLKDPYGGIADIWLGRWFNHAMQCYLDGDYASALSICRSLSPVVKRVEATYEARGLKPPWEENISAIAQSENLWQLPVLEAESERRLHEQPFTPVIQSGNPSVGPQLITALIRDLETVQVRQVMNPGDANVLDDPVVQMLIHEGDAAVEPLLKCLVEDNRLTCSRYTSGMWNDGPIIPVYAASYKALFSILKISPPLYEHDSDDYHPKKDGFHMSSEDRQSLAKRIRVAWQKNKAKLSPFAILQDDNAGATNWFHAVDDIVQPADGTITTFKLFVPSGYSGHIGDTPFITMGEGLRGKSNPSVSDLMIKRFNTLVENDADKNLDMTKMGNLILSLASWDGKNHLNDLKMMKQALDARLVRLKAGSNAGFDITLGKKRVDLGDATALADYANYLKAWVPEALGRNQRISVVAFRTMWEHPDDPVIRQAAKEIFMGHLSTWQRLLVRDDYPPAELRVSPLLTSPLIGLPEFREFLDASLTNTTIIGKRFHTESGGDFIALTDLMDPALQSKLNSLQGVKCSEDLFRTGDYFASRLSAVDGFPACVVTWPQTKRDEAIAACRAFLRQYGDNFKYRPGDPNYADTIQRVVQIHFPKLDHPATPQDVKEGRAIFSLSGTVRNYQMPDFPIGASRPSHPEDPHDVFVDSGTGPMKKMVAYVTGGRVWQAEEALLNGKWERYYGFVGRYQLDKIPAAEIAFSDVSTNEISKCVSISFNGPEGRPDPRIVVDPWSGTSAAKFISVGDPLPVTVGVQNNSGLDQQVPDALMLPTGASNTLPTGIVISVSYSPKLPPLAHRYTDPEVDLGPFQELPMRKEISVSKDNLNGPTLKPTQSLTVLKIDLRDYFELTRTGSYRVKALFHVPGQPDTQSDEVGFSLDQPATAGEPPTIGKIAQPPPKVEPEKIPIPPQQNTPWTPPTTTLPAVVVSAITDLFKDGLADPRGCEYREIEIRESPNWTLKTHGWVLPETGKQRYSIGWNGVLYPLASIGAPADLQKDISEIPTNSVLRQFGWTFRGGSIFEEVSLRPTCVAPVRAALLLRLGQVKSAEAMLNDGYGGEDQMKGKDPFIDMATIWLDRWQGRAEQANINGDYAEAFSVCKGLTDALKKVEATAADRGITKPWPNKLYGEHLWQLQALQADSERRLNEQPYTTVIEGGNPPDGAARIAALIRDLETVHVLQEGNPGDANVLDDPVVQMLIHEGDAAVEPLLKCLSEDNRLTRSQYTAGMGFIGPIIPVYEAAYKALFAIIKTPRPLIEHVANGLPPNRENFHMSQEDRQVMALQLRATWQKDKPLPPAERAFFILQDDKSGSEAWLAAVDEIMESTEPSPRNWKYPSVSDLIGRRFNVLVQNETDANIDQGKLSDLVMDVASLDGKNHLDDFKEMRKELDGRFLRHHPGSNMGMNLAFDTLLWEKLADLGDTNALSDYAFNIQWVRRTVDAMGRGEPGAEPLPANDFRLMWRHPDDPVIRESSEQMFTWNVPYWQKYIEKGNRVDTDILVSPLLGLPAFRNLIDTALSNTNVIGTLIHTGAGKETISFNDDEMQSASSLSSGTSSNSGTSTNAVLQSFRMCDYFAHRLSAVKGFPPCELSWPQDRRDQAVAACRAFLKKHGDDFKYRAGHPNQPTVVQNPTLIESSGA